MLPSIVEIYRQKPAPLLEGIFQHGTVCGQMSSLATAAPVFVGPHRAMMAKRGEHRAVLRGDSGHHSLKTPPISAYQGKSPCILGYQAQRPEKARNTFLAGQKGLFINGDKMMRYLVGDQGNKCIPTNR